MNMFEKYISFEKNNITSFAKEVLSDYYDEELFAKLLNVYIECRYYNFYSDSDNLETSIFDQLKKQLSKLIEGTDLLTRDKLTEMYVIFNYVLCYDEVNILNDKTLVRLLCDYRRELFGINDTIFQENITKLINSTRKKREEFFNYFHTDDFYIKRYTTTKNNVINIELDHNLSFSRLYSDYAIERVFDTDNIREDKLLVEYYLMTNIILKDVRECIFDNYYLIEFATSLFENKEKLENLLSVCEDDCFKNQTVFKINYQEYAKYGSKIKDMIRDGYKFALFVNDNEIDKDDFILFNIFEYIIVNKNSKYCHDMEENDKIIVINDR